MADRADAHPETATSPGPTSAQTLRRAIDHAAHLLPAQGPITVFIHHNTLHAFEDQSFDDGVQHGGAVFGCKPYLTEENYRDKLRLGRIRPADVREVLQHDLGPRAGERVLGFGTRLHLRAGMMEYPLRIGPPAELAWFMAETDALTRLRRDATPAGQRLPGATRRWVLRDLVTGPVPEVLRPAFARLGGVGRVPRWSDADWEAFALESIWRVAVRGAKRAPLPVTPAARLLRPRDRVLAAGGPDADSCVNELLTRFTAAYLDQGVSRWPLPGREHGFLAAFTALYTGTPGLLDAWAAELPAALREVRGLTGTDLIARELAALKLPPADWPKFLEATVLALRGWGGMVQQVELRADSVAHAVAKGSLDEFLGVRLLLDRLAAESLAARLRPGGLDALPAVAPAAAPLTPEQRAALVFQLAQVLGWSPEALHALTADQWATLYAELAAFPSLQRRRVFHAAFERQFRVQTLDALALHGGRANGTPSSPRFQMICCLDEREESFRRHVEEIAPDAETFGAAGFYSVPMYYRGAADAHFVPLCPVVMKPGHYVCESAATEFEADSCARAGRRKLWGRAAHALHTFSRTAVAGAFLASVFGALASVPLALRVMFPRVTSKLRGRLDAVLQSPPQTVLSLERQTDPPAKESAHLGFTVAEMTAFGRRLLEDIGLTKTFAPFVVILGHGSNSQNNPHKSAYDCGACGGSGGGPNARVLAAILNDPRVRENLRATGIAIPTATRFVGGFHNTCNDTVTVLDGDLVPGGAKPAFDAVLAVIDQAARRNAHERTRRFLSAPLNQSFDAAKRHVEERSEDLGQTRPECGHASNAICVVGRRERTRGLYLDRRAFLTSYDPTQDPTGAVLTRIMGAVVPVCGGINLEYYFSYVDSPGYGSGSKLPHNVTSLLGVMDGAASDLRTGLPWQMVEIHDPVRLMIVLETTTAIARAMIYDHPNIGGLILKGWVQVAVLDIDGPGMHLFQDGEFVPYRPEAVELPRAKSSTDWYRGSRENLPFAEIEA